MKPYNLYSRSYKHLHAERNFRSYAPELILGFLIGIPVWITFALLIAGFNG